MKLGEIIREKRINNGLTQFDLSQKLGYDSVQFVSLFERGLSKVPMKVLGKCFTILKFKQKERDKIINKITDEFKAEILKEIIEGENELTK